ncbi:MAG: transferrin receptor-like dimerization domain-containing protein [Pyrinomonadaceae bacterium]
MRHTFLRLFLVFLLSFSVLARPLPSDENHLMGFSTENASARQVELETKFDALLRAENLRQRMKRLSARPHHVGSPYDKENAEFIAAQFKEWGFDTRIEQFDVLFPTPKTRLLEMTAPEKFTAKLEEPELVEDATSGQKNEQLPTYNAYSGEGDVEGDLVFVNYGVPADYEELERRGISVKGKIVIAKYGGSWRGIKPKVAAERGAIGCIIYSDPGNDGYFQGDVYPKGAWRAPFGVQRGSVADMPVFPGDPLTPGIGATKDAKRLDWKNAPTIMKIPVLPISYADAEPLLQKMGGQVAPSGWRGALPLTYHLGGVDSLKVRLKLEFNWDIKPIYDVIAKMPGAERPDEWIMRGNHHDAWVNGADDPVSGLVVLMEEARALGELARQGWKPKRTIVYAAWDGEEPGLLGSTEWVETHAEELKKKLAVYINTDSNGRGFLGVGGSHTLEKFINEVVRDVPDPQIKMSVRERARAARIVGGSPAARREAMSRPDLRISALGSGSDYTPFLQHLGVASLNMGFGGEDGGGSYHSIYDSFDHYTRFGDFDFAYGVTLAKVCGRAVLRLADADVLPFEFTNFADTVDQYADEVMRLTDAMREETALTNRLISSGMLKAVQNPQETYVVPGIKDEVPHLNFAPLQNAVERLKKSAAGFQTASGKRNLSGDERKRLNEILIQTERLLTSDRGLPRRDWFRHQIYAPGFYTGYGVKTLPGVREAIEQRNWKEATGQIEILARTIENFAAEIDRAAGLF